MKNLRNGLFSLVLCSALVLVSASNLNAQEINYNIGLNGIGAEGDSVNFAAEPEVEEEESRSVSYVSNNLSGELIPGNNGIAVVFYNAGIDKISSVTFTITVYNYAGGLVASKTATLTNLKVGSTTYTWKIAKSAGGTETIYLSGTGKDGGEKYSFSASTVRY